MLLRFELDQSYFYPTIADALAQVEPGFNGSATSSETSKGTTMYDSIDIVDESKKIYGTFKPIDDAMEDKL